MMLTEDQGSGSTHGEEESEVLHNRVYRPEVDCHKRSKSWDRDRGMVQVPEMLKNSCLPQAEEGEPERCMERWRGRPWGMVYGRPQTGGVLPDNHL